MQRDLTEINTLAAEIRRTGHAEPAINVKPVIAQPSAGQKPQSNKANRWTGTLCQGYSEAGIRKRVIRNKYRARFFPNGRPWLPTSRFQETSEIIGSAAEFSLRNNPGS